MTQWLLNPSGIEGILTRTEERGRELLDTFTQTGVEDVAAGLGWSPELTGDVMTMVGELISGGFETFTGVVYAVDAGITGVRNIAAAYEQADLDMASQLEGAAQAATEIDFSLEQNGYVK